MEIYAYLKEALLGRGRADAHGNVRVVQRLIHDLQDTRTSLRQVLNDGLVVGCFIVLHGSCSARGRNAQDEGSLPGVHQLRSS